MDWKYLTPIIVSVIGTAGVILAAWISVHWKNKIEDGPEDEELEPPSPPDAMVKIIGTWVAAADNERDKIEITFQDQRLVSGVREFTRNNKTHEYSVTGFYDGSKLSLAATSTDRGEKRTVAIFAIESGRMFVGKRIYVGTGKICDTGPRRWIRQN